MVDLRVGRGGCRPIPSFHDNLRRPTAGDIYANRHTAARDVDGHVNVHTDADSNSSHGNSNPHPRTGNSNSHGDGYAAEEEADQHTEADAHAETEASAKTLIGEDTDKPAE